MRRPRSPTVHISQRSPADLQPSVRPLRREHFAVGSSAIQIGIDPFGNPPAVVRAYPTPGICRNPGNPEAIRFGIPADIEGITASLGLIAGNDHVRHGQDMTTTVQDQSLVTVTAD